MAGYLQIIIWMGCAYLILKGLSILQVGLASNRADRGLLIAIGIAGLGVAVISALGFFWVSAEQTLMMTDIGTSLYP